MGREMKEGEEEGEGINERRWKVRSKRGRRQEGKEV